MKRLLLLLLCISVLLGITGCNAVDKAEDTFNGFMVTLGICDFESALNFTDKDKYKDDFSFFIDNQVYLNKFIDDMSYEIISSEEIDSDNVNIKVKVTSIDMQPIVNTLYDEITKLLSNSKFKDAWEAEDMTTARVEKLLGRLASESGHATISKEVVVKVTEKDGKWLIEPNAEFMEAISGGLEKAIDALDNSPADATEAEVPAEETEEQ